MKQYKEMQVLVLFKMGGGGGGEERGGGGFF